MAASSGSTASGSEQKGVILVTGSCGRIGAAVVKRLGKNYRMVGFELLKAFYASANEELVPCDLGSDESVHQALAHIRHFYGNRITSVIHLAAYYSFTGAHPELYDKITVEGTRRLLKGLQGFEVEQFIFSSTMLIHAPTTPGKKITEDSPIVASWDYPISKIKTEKVIHDERKSIPAVNLRIGGVYDDECHSIPISNQIQRIYEHQLNSYLFPGDLSHGASFVHMDDVVNAIVQAVNMRKGLPPEVSLLISEDVTLSYDYLQRRISSLLFDKEMRTIRVPKAVAKMGAWAQNMLPFMPESFIKPWMINYADDHYELDISKAKEVLHWHPQHYLDSTLPKMIEKLKADPVAWYRINGLKMPETLRRRIEKGHKPS